MLTSLPGLAPGTVRRTVSLEISPDPDWSAGLRVTALGRDLLAGGPDDSRVLRVTRMTVTIDTASRVTSIESALPASVTEPLIGAGAASGFRARLAGLDGLDPPSLESAVLDELPTVRLISGYPRMIELTGAHGVTEAADAADAAGGPGTAARQPLHDRRSPMVGICAGWAPGATAHQRALAGAAIVTGPPLAPAMTSMTPYFHAEPAPQPRSMRRRRILDVAPRPAGYEVFGYFRDSHFDAELREGALHEYEVDR